MRSSPGHSEVFSEPYRFPVAVVLERRRVPQGRWISQRWQVLGVVADCLGHPPVTEIRRDAQGDQTLWRGFTLELHRDQAESYYYNLLGRRPSVFVVCRRDEVDDRVTPVLALVSHYEAEGYAEAGDEVHPVPMPREVHHWVEQFVVDNYRPQVKKSRKREDWHG